MASTAAALAEKPVAPVQAQAQPEFGKVIDGTQLAKYVFMSGGWFCTEVV